MKVFASDAYDGNDNAGDTPGGYILENSSSFYDFFNQKSKLDRKNITLITLNIQPMNGIATNVEYKYNTDSGIFINSNYIRNYSGDMKTEFTGIMYHEIARVWQWTGKGKTPIASLTGIADFFMLKGGFASAKWGKPGDRLEWEEGFDATALFLDYCNDIYVGFVANLNALMKNGFSVEVFQQLTGKTVEELWSDYKRHYGFHGRATCFRIMIHE